MKNKSNKSDNYLDKIPVRSDKIRWTKDDNGIVTIEIDNTGVFNRIAQKLLKKPKVTYIHLDEHGSFVWQLIDGKKSIFDIAEFVDEHFGEDANPLYERLAKYFRILDSYGFVRFK